MPIKQIQKLFILFYGQQKVALIGEAILSLLAGDLYIRRYINHRRIDAPNRCVCVDTHPDGSLRTFANDPQQRQLKAQNSLDG